MQKEHEEEESINENHSLKALGDIPKLFFETLSPESCVLSILSELPPIFDETFEKELDKKIELAENSITVVTENLTNDVLASQQQIFDATDTFLSLNSSIVESSNFIHSMRTKVFDVREKTLSPILSILTLIRDLRRDTKALTVLHFIRYLTTIYDMINSSNFVLAAYTLIQAQYLLAKEKTVYSTDLFDSFVGLTVKPIPTCISPVPINITIGELKKAKCIKNVVSDISSFIPRLSKKMEKELAEISKSNTEEIDIAKYDSIVISYSLITEEIPIAKIIFSFFSKLIRDQSVAYSETNSNDLHTLFRFMENSCSFITKYKQFIEFHEAHKTFGSMINDLPLDVDMSLLEKLPSEKIMQNKVTQLESAFESYYSQLVHFAESNVLQFLSRINCSNLDALSFIRLTRALKEFNSFIQCNGLSDWIKITAADFMSKYSTASNSSIKQAVLSDTWVPTPTDNDFLSLIKTMPSTEESVFNFKKDFDSYASASAITTVRVIHSLICLSLELDAITCFNLIIQVCIYYVACIMNLFSNSASIMDSNDLNHKYWYLFEPSFTESLRKLFKLLTLGSNNALPEQKISERSEAQLMQMLAAADGLELIYWYLESIRENILKRATGACQEKAIKFFTNLNDVILPNFKRNFSVLFVKGVMQMSNLKYQISSANWSLNEVTIEYHQFVIMAKKQYDAFDRVIKNLQLKRTVLKEIWKSVWNFTTYELISAFASVKNYNSFGRSLMAADARMIASYFAIVSETDADTALVLEYVNAYFYQVNEFSKWIDSIPYKFKQKHVGNLVRSGLNTKLSSNESKALLSKIETKYAAVMRL